MQLTIVVPCYNEEAVLHDTLRQLLALADEMQTQKETLRTRILLVDDGSKDNTWGVIRSAAARDSRLTGLKLAHNVGHQCALWAGLEAATDADAVVSIDADLQDDERAIIEMVRLFCEEKADIVYGIRSSRKTDTWFKRNSAQAYYRFFCALGGDVVYNHADYRLMSRRALAALLSYPERNLFLRGLVRTLGFREASVYYERRERQAGESKYPLRKMFSLAWDGITSFSVRPLRLITCLGMMILFVSLLVIVWALWRYFSGDVLPGWTSLLISVWFVGGAILTAVGIIGEYIGKIYNEVKRRPRYFVAERV